MQSYWVFLFDHPLWTINSQSVVERDLIKFGKFAGDVAAVGVSACILY